MSDLSLTFSAATSARSALDLSTAGGSSTSSWLKSLPLAPSPIPNSLIRMRTRVRVSASSMLRTSSSSTGDEVFFSGIRVPDGCGWLVSPVSISA